MIESNHLEDDGRVEGSGRFHDGVGGGGRGHVDRGDGESDLLRRGEELHHLTPHERTAAERQGSKKRRNLW